MTKLWQKKGSKKLNELIEAYTVGNDYILDHELLPYDIVASLAHAQMLTKIGILNKQELAKLKNAFQKIEKMHATGEFKITAADEDMHTAIENYLTATCGDLGKKIHTGRSRNDQILVVMHLYMKDQLKFVLKSVESLIDTFNGFIKEHGKAVLPGYTHMQRAMPMTIKMWAGSYISSLKDDLRALKCVLDLVDQNPLGSAAGFGIPHLNLDRSYTAKLLGFKRVMNPPLYCQNSRLKFASAVVSVLSQIMLSLNKVASDLLLFTTQEFDFFEVDESICTGSSIMPQKRNLDVMEILRANTSLVISFEFRLKVMGENLISGYHRDFQLSKEPVMKSFDITLKSIEVTNLVFESLKPKLENIKKALNKEIYATERAYKLVKNGVNFRDAYIKVKEEL